MSNINFIGAYPVEVPEDEYKLIVTSSRDPAATKKELDSLALLEIEVLHAPRNFSLLLFKQPHTEFAPYDETYYDAKSLEELGCNKPSIDWFRVAFYLHFYSANQPINTPWGEIRCRELGTLPAHLRDKKYFYWK